MESKKSKKWTELSVDEMEIILANCLSNSINLLKDSITLFKKKSYSSSFFLIIISIEEFGKMSFVDDLIYKKSTETLLNDDSTDNWIKCALSNHNEKQHKFLRELLIQIPTKWINIINNKNLDTMKQNAIYVDRNNDPFNIKKENLIEVISLVFDVIVDYIFGLKKGYYFTYIDDINSVISSKQFYNLKKSWLYKSKSPKSDYLTSLKVSNSKPVQTD